VGTGFKRLEYDKNASLYRNNELGKKEKIVLQKSF